MPKKAALPAHPATAHLAAIDADWEALIQRVGPCGLQTMPGREPYEALIRAIAHQQLHGKAAEAILGRFVAMYPDEEFPSPASILETEPELLRACGFSFAKIASIVGIAEGTVVGLVPTRRASLKLDDEELIARLVSLKGVGRWTVEMLLIYTLERPDILPVDDFGVREGWRVLKSLPEQPKPRELAKIGQAWSPHRSAAAWYLWRAAEKVKPAAG
ncbi:DNA-3-methyladenine glycosylase family protein [Undibacterium sp.]|uniref:DNA-3-methyladenine glycosylase family protein n=1 Tax=Undibacterium sp. TaxID=1914977 RepID=UPI00374D98C0